MSNRLPSFVEVIERFPALRTVLDYRKWRAIPYVQQLSASECGVACLAMVLRYYGKYVGVDELRNIAVSGRDATNAQRLIETGRLYGLRGRAVTLEIDQLELLTRAAILHWNFTHFVVFDRVSRDGVVVVDPARGRWCVPFEQFRRAFTGVALLLEPDQQFTPQRERRTLIRDYLTQILLERGFVTHIIIASVILQVLGLALPLGNRLLLDKVIPYKDGSLFVTLALAACFVVGIQGAMSFVRAHLLLYLRTRLDSRMTLGFLDHLFSLPFDFFQRRSTGDLLMRLSSNSTVRDILTGTLIGAALDGTMAVGYLAMLLYFATPLAALTILIASVQFGLVLFTKHKQRQYLAQTLEVQAKSQSYLVETLSAMETLKSMGAEHQAAQRWSALFARELNVSVQMGRLSAATDSIGGAVRAGGSIALLAAGAQQVMANHTTLGGMMALVAIANGFLSPVLNLASSAAQLQRLSIYLERLDDVMRTAPEQSPVHQKRAATQLRGSIRLDDVSFRYGPISELVIRQLSLQISDGEFLALVGKSGSGKSTLARILVSLYAPTSGRVMFDDINVQNLDLPTLRRQIGVVTQQSQLFGGTIRDNIALAEDAASIEDVIYAAKQAQIHDEIEAMPMGYDTVLIDRGASLSGGQQQRIALARALITRPKILLLDEATSQLDASNELAVQYALSNLASTRIVIAHRLSTIRNADRILVLDGGRVVEEGRHDALVDGGGHYRSLVASQI